MSRSRLFTPLLGAAALVACLLAGLSGAAARPGGVWLALPAAAATAAAIAAVLACLRLERARAGLAGCAGLWAPLAALALVPALSGARALSGPPLLALALAGAATVLVSTGWRPGRLAFLPLAFVVLVTAAGRSSVRVGPQGDEPHYLMVAESLLRDHDLALERDYAEGRYAVFHDAPLLPHYRVRGRGGAIYSLHAVGLSVLILPAWALAGYAGVTVFMALLSALLAREVREWTLELTGREGLAEAAAWMLVLSPPLLHYAGLVFTEVPAALAVAFGLRRGGRLPFGIVSAIAVGVVAAFLPWLNVRYAPLAGLVLAHALWRQRSASRVAALLAPAVVSAVSLALHHQLLYGFWNPTRVYGSRPELALGTLREGVPGLLLDQEFGLLAYAPVFVLALPGLVMLVRRERALGVAAVAAVLAVVLTAGSWHMWRGGFNPPGRFLVPLAGILAVAVALVWERRGLTAATALLVGWGLWTGLAGAAAPELVPP